MVNVISTSFVLATLFFSGLHSVQGAWRNLAPGSAVWKDSGNAWSMVMPLNDAKFHYGPARLWTTPVNSDHYEITSRLLTGAYSDCGHVFKYKMGSVRTRSLVTKAWGYYLWNTMRITTNGKEYSPRINYKYATNTWYNLKTVVESAVVKIYINNKLIKQVTMVGEGATSKTNNYVGLWCHGQTNDKGSDFKVKISAWRNLAPGSAVWKDSGNAWGMVMPLNDAKWHYGPARLWTTPVNSDHYEITSRLLTSGTRRADCGHIFKYKMGSVRTRSLVTKAWGYFLWDRKYMYMSSSNGKENSPRINYKYATKTWYNLKTVVKGAVVKIYINNKLVKQIIMLGEGATSTTNNYVGLWCHIVTNDTGSDFKVKILSAQNNKQVNCTSNQMQITIPKSSMPYVLAKDLRLYNPSCGAIEDDKNFYLKTAFDQCGTKSTSTPSIITYRNQVLGRPLASKAVISRIRDMQITFSCSFPRKKILRSSNLQPNNSKYEATFHSQGKLSFSMKLFPTDQFSVPYSKYPISLHLRQLVYIEVSVRSLRKELSILAQQCYATPSSNGGAPKHWLIRDSCPVDPTLKNLASPTKNVQRFSVQAFRFVGNHKNVYFHCHVIACNGNDVNSVCARGCNKNQLGKRGEEERSFKLIQGPVSVRGGLCEAPR